MPWKVTKSSECPPSKPFAVVKSDTGEKVACHATQESAEAQVRALYNAEKASNSITPGSDPKTPVMSAKELHDRWLEQKPEGASHPEDCPFCQKAEEEPTGGTGDSMSDKTYTEEDLKAAVALATQPLAAKIAELEAKDAELEIETKVAEAVAPVKEELDQAKKDLDVATAAVEAAKTELEDVKAFLAAEVEAAKAAEEVAERKAQRVDEAKAFYKAEYVEAQADRWAAMSDEEFAGLIEDLKAAGVKSGKPEDDKLPEETKLSAGRETASSDGAKSNLGAIHELRRAGIDARRI